MATLFYNNIDNISEIPISSESFLNNINKYNDIKFIFPTGRYLRYFNFEYIQNYFSLNNTPVRNVPAQTFDNFIDNLYRKNLNNNKNKLDDYTNHSLIELAFQNTNFKYFNFDNNYSHSLINKLTAVIKGFEDEKIDLEELKNEKNGITNKDKYLDILNLYDNYLDIKNTDYYGITDAEVEISETKNIDINNIYYFELFNEFRRPDLLLIEKLFDSNVPIVINLDYTEDVGPQYDNLTNTVSQLIEKGFKVHKLTNNNQRLDLIRKNLFNANSKQKIDTTINIIKSENKNEEIENIIKLIKELNLKHNISLKDIYIFSRDTKKYSSLIRHKFPNYGIPVNISDRFDLDKSVVINSILNLLRIPANDFKVKDVISVLNSKIFTFELAEVEIEGFIKYSNTNRETRLKYTIDKIFGLDQDKIYFDKVSNYFYNLFSELGTLDQLKANDFLLFIKKLIKKLNIDKNILININNKNNYYNFLDIRTNEKNTRALSALLKLIDSLVLVWNKFLDHENTYNDLFKRLEFLTQITKYQIRELYENGVTFTSIEQARGISKKVGILIGASDGEFPLLYRTNKLIGKELPETEFKHYNNERNLFYQFLINSGDYYNNKENKLYISFSKNDSQKDANPSNYITEIENLFNIKYLNNNYFDNIKLKNNENTENELKINSGILDKSKLDESSLSILTNTSDAEHSQSSLDEFADNPYIYFNKRILNTKLPITFEDSISGLEKGDFYHKVTENYYKFLLENYFLNKDGLLLADDTKLSSEKKIELIDTIITEEIEKVWSINDFTNLDLDISIGLNFQKNIFHHWLEMENKLKLTLENSHVFLLEKEFNISLEGIKIKGKIDRIDLIFLDKIYFIVYDYKSSNTFPSTNDIKNYKSFQLPIYLFAAQEILKNEFEIEAEIGGAFYVNLSNTTNKFSTYYNLRIGNPLIIDLFGSLYSKSNRFVSITNDNAEEKTKLAEELKKIQDNIENGEFEINQDAKKNYDYDQLIRDYSVF